MSGRFAEEKRRNRLLSTEEFETGRTKLQSLPRLVFMELTRDCNLRCPMCKPAGRHGFARRPDLDMPERVFRAAAEQLFAFAEVVDLRGVGESTILENFCERLGAVLEYGARPRLVTNLSYVNDAALESLVEADAMLTFSLDAVTPELFARIRRGGRFELVEKNLGLVRDLRSKWGTCGDITCNVVVQGANLPGLDGILSFVARYGVERVHAWPVFSWDEERSPQTAQHARMIDAFGAVSDRAASLGIALRILDWPYACLSDDRVLAHHVCIRPWMYTHVNHDGSVGVCDTYPEPVDEAGAQLPEVAFQKIWNGPDYRRLREHHRGKPSGPVSGAFRFCRDVCSPRRFVEIDDLLYPPFRSRVLSDVQGGRREGGGGFGEDSQERLVGFDT